MALFFTRKFILSGLFSIIILSKSFTIDVQYKPHTPIIRPNKAQQKATCTAEGNPEPDIVWTLPDGTTDSNPTVLMQVHIAFNLRFNKYFFRKSEIRMLRTLAWLKMLTESLSWRQPTGIWTNLSG
jgi:hypothetical protein